MRKIAESLKYNTLTQLFDSAPHDTYKTYKIIETMQIEQINKLYEHAINSPLSEKFMRAIAYLGERIKEEILIEIYGIKACYYYMTESLCWPHP